MRAEGIAMGEAPKAAAIESARGDIRTVTAEAANQSQAQQAA